MSSLSEKVAHVDLPILIKINRSFLRVLWFKVERYDGSRTCWSAKIGYDPIEPTLNLFYISCGETKCDFILRLHIYHTVIMSWSWPKLVDTIML